MPATIKDIRRETGLSLATISKYLNGGNVLPRNRELIDAAIKKLDYRVNEMARGLVTNRSTSVGVLVERINNMFSAEVLRYIGEELRKHGYSMIICNSDNDPELEKENVRFLVNKKVDGIIVIAVSREMDFLQMAIDAEIPIVAVDRRIGDIDSVTVDNRISAGKVADLLISKGHRRIAVIGSAIEYTGLERTEGFIRGLAGHGLDMPAAYKKMGTHSLAFGYEAMKELMSLPDRPTAVFTTNYDLNIGVIMAINELHIDCPEEISIVGFDNLYLPQIIRPGLTVVEQPIEEMGVAGARLLMDKIHGEAAEQTHIELKTHLRTAGSVADLKEK